MTTSMYMYNDTAYEHYYYTYEVESFVNLIPEKKLLEILNKCFVAATILVTFADFLLLVTIFSAQVRQQSAGWYMAHLNFLTILRVLSLLPKLEGTFHTSYGTCMFYTYLDWAFSLLYVTNLILMDVEIIATVFTTSPRWKACSKKRFFISMTILWNASLLTSAVISFFGYEEHIAIPICFNQNKAAHILGAVFKERMPFAISIIFSITGTVFFIRTKRKPENYNHVTENSNSVQTINEWFACFMAWNTFTFSTSAVVFVLHSHMHTLGFAWIIALQMVLGVIYVSLPLTCIFLEPVRTVFREWPASCIRSMSASRRVEADTQHLPIEMETC
ncbi:uncharacterized protein LOC132758144 [Ruditapes philippinarum]|uniref:uncharacterized protein LOC132758144 n=1 Tax=Ruditapes philippinarum TaxID=129788 RepID=UPI00295B10F3|nr:uncharacterized protein LOC132758144 [Ruditapes philippinarum]XP_060605659.1 uncharacterized protein LOC132758144 [Ruditapes philippinarum]